MKMPPFSYHRPDTVDEVLELLGRIGRVRNLANLHLSDSSVHIGANVTHAIVEDSALVATEVPEWVPPSSPRRLNSTNCFARCVSPFRRRGQPRWCRRWPDVTATTRWSASPQ